MFKVMALVGLGIGFGIAFAQPPATSQPARFKWQTNQTLNFKVVQQTAVSETILDEKSGKATVSEARTHLALTRKWTVKDVDPSGTATLEMAITAMKNELRQPDGSTSVRDSANPEHAKDMAAYLNTPIVAVRVDTLGRLVEVKLAVGGSATRLHAELPFRAILPEVGPAPAQSWERPFAFKLDPPHGTGESYDFLQKYTCKDVKDGMMVIGVETSLKVPPKTVAEQIPLVPLLWTGDVYFHMPTGMYRAARLKAKAELPNHLGAGSKFVYESIYSEDFAEK